MKKTFRVLLALAALYALLILAGCGLYRKVLFPSPSNVPPIPPGYGELISTKTSDGTIAQGLYFPPPNDDAPVVIFFHGNGETISYELWRSEDLRSLGYGVMIGEYRGYGTARSSGPPTEAGLYADAEAEIQAIEARGIAKNRIAIWGFSLGTGVASEMAFRGHGCALVLEAPFTSISEMADRYAPFLPTSLIVKDKFDTLSKAPRITIPTVVAHGDRDTVVPFPMGEKVARTLPRAQFIGVPGGHHTDLLELDQVRIYEAASKIINSACRAPGLK